MVLITKILLGSLLALLLLLPEASSFAPILAGKTTRTPTTTTTTSLHVSKEAINPSGSAQHEWYTDGSGWADWHASDAVEHDSTQKDDWVSEAFKTHTPMEADTVAPAETKKKKKDDDDKVLGDWYTDGFGWMSVAHPDPDKVLSVEKNKERPRAGGGPHEWFPASMYWYVPPEASRVMQTRAPLKRKDDAHEWFMEAIMEGSVPSKLPIVGPLAVKGTMKHHELFTDAVPQTIPMVGSLEKGSVSNAEWFTSALATGPLKTPRPVDTRDLKGASWFTAAMEDSAPDAKASTNKVVAKDEKHSTSWFTEAMANYVPDRQQQHRQRQDPASWFSGALKDFVPLKMTVAPQLGNEEIQRDSFTESLKDFIPPGIAAPAHLQKHHQDSEWFMEELENLDLTAKPTAVPPLDRKMLERHKWMGKNVHIPVHKSEDGLKQYVFSNDDALEDGFGDAGP